MTLEELGYTGRLAHFRSANDLGGFEIGRVVAEHRERYLVRTAEGELEAEITGHLRFTARNREDFPAVGDWVALVPYDSGSAIIHTLFPRSSTLRRQATGTTGEAQIIAVNIDYAFIVQAVDRDFNLNRIERYLTLCNASNVGPIIAITKIDLIQKDQLSGITERILRRVKNVPVIAISNETQEGYDRLRAVIEKGKTYCMLGSSGVGKSTLLNNLAGKSQMRTGAISKSTNRGRHVTSHRELMVLESGGILIDNPGMREVGIADSRGGLEITFDMVASLSEKCRFKNCTHTIELGCAVLEAVEKGEMDRAYYENFLKMERESTHFESTVAERKKKDKQLGKIIKRYNKQRNSDVS